jgi:hypothetical protein
MLLRDLQIIDGRSDAGIMTPLETFAIQVVELYLWHASRKVRTEGVAKVLVVLRPRATTEQPRDAGDGRRVDWPFDFESHEKLADFEKRRLLLEQLRAALTWLALRHRWDTSPLERAYAASLAAGLVFRGRLLRKDVRHPKLDLRANCSFEFRNDRIIVSVVVLDGAGSEIGAEVAFSTVAAYAVVPRLIEGVCWQGHSRVRVVPGRYAVGEPVRVIDVSGILQRPGGSEVGGRQSA